MSRAVDQCAAARGRRRRDVALSARLSAGLRAHPGRFRRDHRRDRAALVSSEATGRARHRAALSRRHERALRCRSSSICTAPAAPPTMTRFSGRRCLDTLAPGGCLANNWADFAVNPAVRPMADSLSAVARGPRSRADLVTRRGFRDNLVQYVADRARHRGGSDHRRARALCPAAPYPRPRPRDPGKLHRRHPLSDRSDSAPHPPGRVPPGGRLLRPSATASSKAAKVASIASRGRSRVMKTMRVRRSSLGHSGNSTGG